MRNMKIMVKDTASRVCAAAKKIGPAAMLVAGGYLLGESVERKELRLSGRDAEINVYVHDTNKK